MAELNLRIDWSEIDVFGHVNNVAFFKYIQAGRVSFCESIGLSSLNEVGKLSFIVASTNCSFKLPLEFPGEIKVVTKINWIKNSSFQLDHKILNNSGDIVAESFDILVLYDYFNKSKVVISDEMKEVMLKEK